MTSLIGKLAVGLSWMPSLSMVIMTTYQVFSHSRVNGRSQVGVVFYSDGEFNDSYGMITYIC